MGQKDLEHLVGKFRSMHLADRLYFPEEFRRNSVYSCTFISYPAELGFPMSPENGKGTKRNSKLMSSLPVLQLIYIRIS